MIKDCQKGKIDLILTKSVSRFARNTVDSLNYVRKLKAMGIGVFFEEQNLDSLKEDSEMLLGFYSVLAQSESESISGNVKWGIRERMKSGTFAFRYNILGYEKGEDGEPKIVESEAVVIRKIFDNYLNGDSIDQIKDYLEKNNITAKKGRAWSKSTILSVLTNERYSGDLLMQKTFTENCISKKVKVNRGEKPRYLITNNHPAIIDKITFKKVQMEIAKRGNVRKTSDLSITNQGKYSGKFALTELLICGECGSPYRRKTWTYCGKNKKVWRCLSRVEHGQKYCKDSISIEEEQLKCAIVRGLSRAIENRSEVANLILCNLTYLQTGNDGVLDAYVIEQEMKKISNNIDETIQQMIKTEGDKELYKKQIEYFNNQYLALEEQLELAKVQISANEQKNAEIENIKDFLKNDSYTFETYDEVMLRKIVEYIQVFRNNIIVIMLKGGIKIEERI